MRHFFCIFLLLLMPLHSVATALGGAPASERAFEVRHELNHLHGVSHHHGDDGDIHYDDSGESARHHAEHSGSAQPSALPTLEFLKIVLLVHPLLRSEPSAFVPDPVLERPPRPPRTFG